MNESAVDDWAAVADLVHWLDSHNGRSDHETAMRLIKLGEEVGEVMQAYIGMTGQNPRKGVNATADDVIAELGDVIVTAMVALVTITGDHQSARERFTQRIASLTEWVRSVKPADG